MGRGDQKTKKGKRARGSYGNSRPKKSGSDSIVVEAKPKKEKVAKEKKATPEKKVTKKKATATKKPAKKTDDK